jgi:hypothetical protein
MPIKIVRTPEDPTNFIRTVYVPDRQRNTARPNPQRPLGRPRPGSILAPSGGRHFVLGLDLGQSEDFSTLIAVEPTSAGYEVGMIARTRGKAYPSLVQPIVDLLAQPPFAGAATLVVDRTGLGAPVYDLLNEAGLSPVGITITAGRRVTGRPRLLGVPKRDLVSVLLVLLQAGALKIASELPHAATLARELQTMRRHVTAAGNDQYGAAEGEHDDLVMGLAIAVWFAENRMARPMKIVKQPAPSAEADHDQQRPAREPLTPRRAVERLQERSEKLFGRAGLIDPGQRNSIDKL